MRSPLASRTPLRGAGRGPPRAVWTAAAPALRQPRSARSPWGRGARRGPGAAVSAPGLGGRRRCRGGRAAGRAGGRAGAARPPGESAGSGPGPAARRQPGVAPSAGKTVILAALLPKSGSRQPAPGPPPAAVPGLRAPQRAPRGTSEGWGQALRASPVTSQRGGADRERTRRRRAQRRARCSRGPRPRPPRSSPRNLSALRQQDPKPRKEIKSEGAGALRTPASSQGSCGKTAALLLAERGCERGAGRGPPSAGSGADAPPAGSAGGCSTAGEARGRVPEGRDLGSQEMRLRSPPRAPRFPKCGQVFGD